MLIACHRFQARHGDARAGRGARGYTSGARGHASSTRGRHHDVGALESVPDFPHYVTGVSRIIMQNPTDQAETSITTETTVTNNGPNWIRTVKVPRKAAKRILPFELTAEEPDLVSPPQAEDVPTRKKPRLEEPLPITTDEATRETASTDVLVELSSPTADDENENADPMTDTQPNAGATGSWTLQEDAKLTRAVANTSKKKWGKEYMTNWPAIFELIPGRTQKQCWQRWNDVLDPSIGRASGRKGKWTAVEDSKLKDAVQTHGDKDWVAISLLVPGRTNIQCWSRWNDTLDPSIALTAGRTGAWEEDEDIKLKDAVQTQGDKDWAAISALVPGRTRTQCCSRWHHTLDPSIGRASGCKGTWEEDEDIKLEDAVQTQGDKDWAAIAALIPGRTRSQCYNRWHAVLNANTGRASARTGKWSAVEDSKLKHAVQTHGDKGWAAISALVPGRTGKQCNNRWRLKKHMDSNRTIVREKDRGTLKKVPAVDSPRISFISLL
jgi:hypothetical protein